MENLTRYDKLIAVCWFAIDELENAGLLTAIERGVIVNSKHRALVNKWDEEEKFTDEEIRQGIDDLIQSGTLVIWKPK